MTTRSPRREGQSGGAATAAASAPARTRGGVGVEIDPDAFWSKMGGMLGGLESRMKQDTDQVKEQLGVGVYTLGDLGSRVDKAEKRLEGLADKVNSIVDKRLANVPFDTEIPWVQRSEGSSYAGLDR